MWRAFGASLCVWMVVATGFAAGPPLAEKLPAGTVLYVGWAGQTPAFQKSKILELVREPGFQKILQTVRAAILAQADNNNDARQALDAALGILEVLWQRPVAMAVTRLPEGDSNPGVVWLVDPGPLRKDIEKHLATLTGLVPKDEDVLKQGNIAGQAYSYLDGPAGKLAWGFLGDLFFVAVGEDAIKELLERHAAGKAETMLAANESFKKAATGVGAEGAQLVIYADLAKLLPFANALLHTESGFVGDDEAPTPGGPHAAENAATFKRVVQALGLSKATAYAAAWRVTESGGMLARGKIFSPAPHQGYLKLLAGRPLQPADLDAAPADSMFVAAFNLSPAEFYQQMRGALRAVDPAAERMLLGEIAQADKELGLSIEKDLIEALDDNWLVTSAESQGGLLTGSVLSVKVKDAARLEAAMEKIVAHLQPPKDAKPDVTFHVMTAGDARIRYASFAQEEAPFSPAWSIYRGRLYVAGWPQVIRSAVTSIQSDRKGASLAAQEKFQKLRQGLAKDAAAIIYADMPMVARRAYPFLLAGWTGAAAELREELRIDGMTGWLPALPKMESYLQPTMMAVSADNDGVLFEEQMGLPLQAFSLAPLLTLAVPVGAVEAGRDAVRVASTSNIHGISLAAMTYFQAGSARQMPPDLAVLVKDKLIEPKILVHPSSGHAPPKLEGGKLVGEVDYVYVGAAMNPMTQENPGECVVVYEKLKLARSGQVAVGFLDGHASTVPVGLLRKMLQNQGAPAPKE